MNKLYVGNVPLEASEEALRQHFASCGGVLEVEILREARSGKPRGLAQVTMTSPAYTLAALTRLHGAVFGGATLQVTDAPVRSAAAPARGVKILQQFRERATMAYDLDCAGLPLTLRVSPVERRDAWEIEARSKDGAGAVVAHGSAETRAGALAAVVRAWNDAARDTAVRPLDGEGLLAVLRDVRAV